MKNTEGRTFARSETFRVATYNVENYLDETASRCCVKSVASKAKVRECIRALRPDVLALQEMGSVAALMELRGPCKRRVSTSRIGSMSPGVMRRSISPS